MAVERGHLHGRLEPLPDDLRPSDSGTEVGEISALENEVIESLKKNELLSR